MTDINQFSKIIVANWKLNGSFDFINSFFEILESKIMKNDVCGIICPPFIYLDRVNLKYKSFYVGAQDCSNFQNGAYTGEISASMIMDNNCKFCILGHSERRQIFNQRNQDIRLKMINIIKEDIVPILCIGETLEQKENGKTNEILEYQIMESLPENCENKSIIIAYEPIWAIGSGLIPSLEEIKNVHSFIRNHLKNHKKLKILYGGSVKSSNASEIMNVNNVDGVLVGGASLDPLEFIKILDA